MLSSQGHLYITLLMCKMGEKSSSWLLFPVVTGFQTKQKVEPDRVPALLLCAIPLDLHVNFG